MRRRSSVLRSLQPTTLYNRGGVIYSWRTLLGVGLFITILTVVNIQFMTGTHKSEVFQSEHYDYISTGFLQDNSKDLNKRAAEKKAEVIHSYPFLVNESQYGNVTIEYTSLQSQCSTPARLPGYNNLCWNRCYGENCKRSITNQQGSLNCAPSIWLLGVRKSATTDLSQWFREHPEVLAYNADYDMTYGRCAVDQAASAWKNNFRTVPLPDNFLRTNFLYNDAPGEILQFQNFGFTKKDTALRVETALQHLKVITTEQTKFILILRNPAERVVSQLKEWKKLNLLKDRKDKELDADYIHSKVLEQVKRVSKCFKDHGPKACTFLTPAKDGKMDALLLWGLYVEYLEEAYNFLPKEQMMVVSLTEYESRELETVKKIFRFTGLNYVNLVRKLKGKKNQSAEVRVHEKTMRLLIEFYRPFNRRLVKLLGGDKKWCFSGC